MRWEDLDDCMAFAKGLAEEYAADVYHGTGMAKAPTRVEEMEWLSRMLLGLEKGTVISAAAEVEGAFAGNSEVQRGTHPDLLAHGTLAIAVSRPYRGIGVGSAMLRTLTDECRAAGLKTIGLAVLGTNVRAIALYERAGFSRAGLIPNKYQRRGTAIDQVIMSMQL